MDKLKRFIDCYIATQTCNLRCHYCYITQQRKFKSELVHFSKTPQEIRKALSIKRLGGVCLVNFCAGGETLLAEDVLPVLQALLEEGHYVMVVTNGTLTKRFEEIAMFPAELLKHLFFKFSFHYLELKRLHWIERFFANVELMRSVGCSFTIEITPNDEIISCIDEIKALCMERLGALCHVTIARNDKTDRIEVLTSRDWEEYQQIWKVFNSELFSFKSEIFYKKRREFCYAGDWSVYINLSTGDMQQCYCGKKLCNIYEDMNKPLTFEAIGKNCDVAHCYNGHAFLTLGDIPELETITYAQTRNRIDVLGREWLQPEMKAFMSQKLRDNNDEYSIVKKRRVYWKNKKKKLIVLLVKMPLGKIIRNVIYKIKKYRTKLPQICHVLKPFFLTYRDKKRIVLIGSPFHGNLGDHAISIAERRFFIDQLPDRKVIEVVGEDLRQFLSFIKYGIKKDDAIVITGGGFLGNLWIEEEKMVREIVNSFADNKIIIMPQTIYFTLNESGKKELQQTKEVYERHPDLNICLRDRKSYNLVKTEMRISGTIFYLPDMVTYLNEQKGSRKRGNILFCIRSDKEKVLDDAKVSKLCDFFDKKELAYSFTTTVLDKRIFFYERAQILEDKLEEFRQSSLVITDRLHAMLFAAITGTPCLAFDNVSGKIEGAYEWIHYLDYIKYAIANDAVYEQIDELLNIEETQYVNRQLRCEFNRLVDLLR